MNKPLLRTWLKLLESGKYKIHDSLGFVNLAKRTYSPIGVLLKFLEGEHGYFCEDLFNDRKGNVWHHDMPNSIIELTGATGTLQSGGTSNIEVVRELKRLLK